MLLTVVLLGSLVTAVVWVAGHDRNGRDAVHSTSAAGIRTQHTVLLQVRGAGGAAMSTALLARDTQHRSSAVVLVPNLVEAQVPGSGTEAFGLAVAQADGPAVSRSTLSDLLGVRVDASWVLDQAAFARLVDAIGGIKVDVDVDVIGKQGKDNVVVVPKGTGQQLNGARALAVLSYRAPGEDELRAIPRFEHVVAGVLARLPAGTDALTLLAAKLGKGCELSDPGQVTSVVDGIRADASGRRAAFLTMPVLAVDAAGQRSYRMEAGGVNQMVNQILAASRLPGRFDPGNRVLVLDEVGTPGLGLKVRDKIVAAGFVFVDARDEKPFGNKSTTILVFDSTSRTMARGGQLAASLGLPHAPVKVTSRAQNIADLIVLLGSDFTA